MHKSIDIDRGAQIFDGTACLFRGHETGCSHDLAGTGHARITVCNSCKAKISQFRFDFARHEHVGRLQVAVDNPALMTGRKCPGNFIDERCGLFWFQRVAIIELVEVVAVDEFHCDEGQWFLVLRIIGKSEFEYLNDARVLYFGKQARFVLDSQPGILAVIGNQQSFYGNGPAKFQILPR